LDYRSINILIIDDEIAIRYSLTSFFEDYDFNVTSAASAEEALEILNEKKNFHVAIVDLRLPGMTGDKMILEASKIYPELKYLIHTGSINYFVSDELKNIGFKDEFVFLKPQNNLKIFIDAIEKLLESKK